MKDSTEIAEWIQRHRCDDTTHGQETPFVFLQTDAVPSTNRADAASVARAVSSAWAAFARFDEPGHPGLGEPWPRYDTDHRATMILADPPRVESDPFGADRQAWDRYSPASDPHPAEAD